MKGEKMDIGAKVKIKSNRDFGIGQIVNRKQVFGKNYFIVFFENISKTLEFIESDIEKIESPAEMIERNIFSSPLQFKLKALSHQLESLASNDGVISPANFKIKPLPHQIITLNFVLNQFKPRCLLADEVGLGKTIEAALIFEELKMRGMAKRILIITPAGLTRQWQDELKIKFDENFYIMDKSSADNLTNMYGTKGNIWLEQNQMITSIDFIKPKKIRDDLSKRELSNREEHNNRIFEDCIKSGWDVVIIDEAHKLTKDFTGEITARYKLGEALSKSTPIFLLLTATPHKGKPYIFKNLLQLIDEHMFFSIDDITPENVRKVTVRNKKRDSVDLEGKRLFNQRITEICPIDRKEKNNIDEINLYEAISEYVNEYYNYALQDGNKGLIFLLMMYQRIVSSSSKAILTSIKKRLNNLENLKQLSKINNFSEDEEFFEKDGEEQIEILEKNLLMLLRPELIEREIEILKNCINLAEKCVTGQQDSKLKMTFEIIDEIKRRENITNLKMIIFTEFKVTQNYIKEELEKTGYKTAIINGDLSLDKKMEQKKYFYDEADFLISTDAGGEGVNLQFASHMINYDMPWNPMKLEQRIGRIDRIGQEKDVKIFNFVIKGTIEERVRSILEQKLEIIKNQFGEDQLKDILSTLQEDFNFDKIYFDAIVLRKKEAETLESIAQEMFNEAKNILENDNFLVPFIEEENLSKNQKKMLISIPNRIKSYLTDFLLIRGYDLQEYSDRKDIFFFKNNFKDDIFGSHFKNVIFKPQKGLEYEDSELLSLNSEYIKNSFKEAQNSGMCSSLSIDDDRFNNGLLTYWELKIKNNYDYNKSFYIPIFIEKDGYINKRVSDFFKEIDELNIDKTTQEELNVDTKLLIKKSNEEAEKAAENVYISLNNLWLDKIEEKKKDVLKYLKDKEKAIKNITIENIRDSKLKALNEEINHTMKELENKKNLVPELELKQLAYIRFGGK